MWNKYSINIGNKFAQIPFANEDNIFQRDARVRESFPRAGPSLFLLICLVTGLFGKAMYIFCALFQVLVVIFS